MPERIAKTKAKVERAERKRNPVQVNREILGKMEIRRKMGTLRMKMQIRGTVNRMEKAKIRILERMERMKRAKIQILERMNPMRKTIPVRQILVLRVEMQI